MTRSTQDLIAEVRQALGRAGPLDAAPAPPDIPEPIARLVHSDIQLPELFAKTAAAAKFVVDRCTADEIGGRLISFLNSKQCRKIGLSNSPLWETLQILPALKSAGLEVRTWNELTLDAAYDIDCGVTDVYAAVAETGSLAIRPSPEQGRALSLVPPIHVAIVHPRTIVPDLLDLFEKIRQETPPPAVTLITGPSQTADIEAVMVTGVHGPGVVAVFILN